MIINKLSPELQLVLAYSNRLNQEVLTQLTASSNPEVWELLIEYRGDFLDIPEEIQGELVVLNANYLTGFLNKRYIDVLSEIPTIIYMDLSSSMSYIGSAVLNSICALNISTMEAGYSVTGEGTLLAVIDSGIDYMHEDFRNNDNTTRILYLWDQTLIGTPPEGFKKGIEFTKSDIDEALSMPTKEESLQRVPSIDAIGHGTAMTGIAAGNGRTSDGQHKGLATNTKLIIVKAGSSNPNITMPRDTDIMQGIKYVLMKAQELNAPVCILLGTGTNKGAHNGKSAIEQYIDQMSVVWKNNIIVGTGNQANKDSHIQGKLSQGEHKKIQLIVAPNQLYYMCSIWKNFLDDIELIVQSPRGESTQVLSIRVPNRVFVFGDSQLFVSFSQPTLDEYNQKILILFEGIPNIGIEQGLWTIMLRGTNIVQGSYYIWGSIVENTQTRFLTSSLSTTLTIPSTASNITSVAGFNPTTSQIAAFSGRGFTKDERLKPDISAPAVGIVTTSNDPNVTYESVTGTSAAAAFVAGAYLLCMEYERRISGDWTLYGGELKVYMLRTARRPQLNAPYPNPQWGYGILCIEEMLNEIRSRR